MEDLEVEKFLDNDRILQIQEKLNALMEEKTSNKLIVAFCGIFNAGKSSIINAILNQEFKLPTGGQPMTKFITRIEYGESFQPYCYCDGHKEILTTEQVKSIVCGKTAPPDRCSEIVLQMLAEILKPNIVFLDTPGYEDEEFLEELTRETVRKADLAVFCCNADHFGRRFEQEYFQELEESLGNFCVVVNHTDIIHTDEEFERLKIDVEKMAAGRGQAKLYDLVHKTIFFTVGAGRYIDLDGLDTFFMELRNSENDGWRILKDYADRRKAKYQLQKLQSVVDSNIQQGVNIIENLHNTLKKEYEENLEQYELECKRIEKIIISQRNICRDLVDKQFATISEKLKDLEKEGKHQNFVKDASEIIRENFMILPSYMASWKQVEPFIKGHNVAFFSAGLSSVIKGYNVPAPKGEKVKNRGLVGALLVTTIVSTLTLSPYWDDGYDMEYHGYADDAIRSIKSKLLPKINAKADCYLQELQTKSQPCRPKMDESVLKLLYQKLEAWRDIQEEITYYIERLSKADN